MMNTKRPICSRHHIQFNPVHTEIQGPLKSGQGIFGVKSRRTPVTDQQYFIARDSFFNF
jgi:hypothetical protein